jgi:hypothetical protein
MTLGYFIADIERGLGHIRRESCATPIQRSCLRIKGSEKRVDMNKPEKSLIGVAVRKYRAAIMKSFYSHNVKLV